jgi:hypothetical protein
MAETASSLLNDQQQERLLTARASGEEEEGEERLERLRQREEDVETLRLIRELLNATNFRAAGQLSRAQLVRLLSLFRALAPNPNLDARILTRPGEPETFNRDLQDLLYGPASAPVRLQQFMGRRHAGEQTVLQLLCGACPAEWPLVTKAGLQWLEVSPEQRRLALQAARLRFDLPAEPSEENTAESRPTIASHGSSDPLLSLLADVMIYNAVRACIDAADYLVVHRLLTGASQGVARRRRSPLLAGPLPGPPVSGFPLPFPSPSSQATAVSEPGRPDYSAAPTPDPAGFRTADLLAIIETEVATQGFTYPPLTLRDYFLCLQSKPFVWLLGANGIGKTRLTSLFASALTGDRADQYRLIPVRPDWGDSSPLLGYVNLLADGGKGRYVMTPFLDFLLRAAAPANADRAYFLCLDEMNLARVEHYFAEALSAMETAGRELLLPNGYALPMPPNLFITGTLNTDESTHTLSRKVLDRANTLSLRAVSLQALPPPPPLDLPDIPTAMRQLLFLRRRVTTANQARNRLAAIGANNLAEWVVDKLVEVNAMLEPYDFQFAYRLRDEALCYCANSFDIDQAGLLSPEAPRDTQANITVALDFQLLQKVLPRLGGTQETLEPLLNELLRWAETGKFIRTAQSLRTLLVRLRRDGFVSFD